jgi:NADH-quinone oxidoreductase subunit J
METILFYLFASMAVLGALLVVGNPFSRNPVTSAMFLVVTMASLAGLFVLLHAFFLAAIQILVYAGAVMVLFLFVIMLLDLKEEERRRVRWTSLAAGLLSVGTILTIFVIRLGGAKPDTTAPATLEGQTPELGRLLFERYLLPLEIVGVLLLVAMVGVVLLSKKDLR